MKIVDIFSHRNGRDILEGPNFVRAFHEFLGVLQQLPPYRAANPKKTSASHIIAPLKMNAWLDRELAAKRDWEPHPLIIDAPLPVTLRRRERISQAAARPDQA